MMQRAFLAGAMMSLGLAAATVALPARAQEDPLSFDVVFKMADTNKDGMVSKPEFMEAMGKAYDMKMSKMKSMKDDKMMKGDAMTRDGYKSLIADIYKGA